MHNVRTIPGKSTIFLSYATLNFLYADKAEVKTIWYSMRNTRRQYIRQARAGRPRTLERWHFTPFLTFLDEHDSDARLVYCV